MSLESIYRVVSNALKSAQTVNTGSAEEQAAMDVLGGLSAMLEARVQLHRHATPATQAAEAAAKTQPTVGAPKPVSSAPVPTATGFQKQRKPADSDDSYDLK
jgi:hypothetical protein